MLQEAYSFTALCFSDSEKKPKTVQYDLPVDLKGQLVEGSASQPVEVQVCWTFSDEEININSVEAQTFILPHSYARLKNGVPDFLLQLADQNYISQNNV